jgi:predicted dinucleotide-binding enzyme
MRIGIIGSGGAALSLAQGFVRIGHEVMVGSRTDNKPTVVEWLRSAGPGAQTGSYAQAAKFADVAVLAVPGRALPEVVGGLNPRLFDGKVVIDITNPPLITQAGVVNAFGEDDSGAEYLQRSLPGAGVVKAFSQILAAQMGDPGPNPPMPLRICGDNADAKAVVTELGTALGWRVRDIGPLTRARALENGAVDWMRGRLGNGTGE